MPHEREIFAGDFYGLETLLFKSTPIDPKAKGKEYHSLPFASKASHFLVRR